MISNALALTKTDVLAIDSLQSYNVSKTYHNVIVCGVQDN